MRRVWILLGVLAAGLVLRLVLWAGFAGLAPQIYDEKDYDTLAVSLAERGEYALEPGKLSSQRPPLYPATVSLLYRAFGVRNYQAVRLFQVIVSLLTVVVLYFLALEVFDSRVALGAAAPCCFYPSLAGHAYLLLTEVLFTFWLCLACYLLARFLKTGNLPVVATGGVVLGLAALTRSVMWPFPPIFLVLLLCTSRLPYGRRFAAAALFGACFVATLTPWAVRNTRLEGTFTIVDTMGGRVFELGNRLFRIRNSQGTLVSATPDAGEVSGGPPAGGPAARPVATTQGQMDQRAAGRTLGFLGEQPLVALKHFVIKAFLFWQLEREIIAAAQHGYFGPLARPQVLLVALLICSFYAFAMATGVLGLVTCRQANRSAGLLLLLVTAHVWGVHTLTISHSRYHIPLMPLVLIFSAAALVQGRGLFRREHLRGLCVGFLILAALLASWAAYYFLVDQGKLTHKAEPGSRPGRTSVINRSSDRTASTPPASPG